ncbi:hypothetical protein [Chthonobacter albigriseus]|uniref:hypothetical protein n=1 Tax=Chthonobacter albigriseus TaxID=1683161 RepID=UPI0015EEF46B|nr:hypothetical protein [Chthonobacter albigriseus]
MLAFLLRSLGLFVFAAAFVALIADGVRSLAVDGVVVTSLQTTWAFLSPATLQQVETVAKGSLPPYIWTDMIVPVLGLPAFAVGGVLGIVLLLLGRRRPRHALLA